jgi:zinc transport system substrate-binding protein
MKYLKFIAISLFAALVVTSCGNREIKVENHAVVSIAPLKPLVESILGDDFEITVLVPKGSSPETFEPTPKQLQKVESARFVFGTGLLEFEQALLHRVARNEQIINLSQGIDVVAGTCSHAHHAHANCSHHHAHGIDPHIWCSPKALIKMSENAYSAISREMPDSTKYQERYNALNTRLLALDSEVAQMCGNSPHKSFVIYHPALTYLARDYGLTQIAVENEGKEPSAKHLAEIIEHARKDGIKHIFYQSEFPASSVEVICQDTGATAVEINPLAEDIFENIHRIATLITE